MAPRRSSKHGASATRRASAGSGARTSKRATPTSASGRAPRASARATTGSKRAASSPSATSSKRRNTGSSDRAPRPSGLRRWLIPVIVSVLAGSIMLASYYPVLRVHYRELREKARLEAELAALQSRNARLRDDVAWLKTPEGVEDLARRQLGLVKKGENVAVIVDERTATSTAVAALPTLDNDVPTAAAQPAGRWTAFLDRFFAVEQ